MDDVTPPRLHQAARPRRWAGRSPRLPQRPRMVRAQLRAIGHGASLDAGRIPDEFFDWREALTRDTRSMRSERDMVRAIVSGRSFRPGLTFERRGAGRDPTAGAARVRHRGPPGHGRDVAALRRARCREASCSSSTAPATCRGSTSPAGSPPRSTGSWPAIAGVAPRRSRSAARASSLRLTLLRATSHGAARQAPVVGSGTPHGRRDGDSQAHPAARSPRRRRREAGAVRRLGDAGAVRRDPRGAHGGARARPASSTSATWARSRPPGPAPRRCCSGCSPTTSSKIAERGAQYSVLCNEQGGVLDDLFTYRLGPDRFLTVTNASNHERTSPGSSATRASTTRP